MNYGYRFVFSGGVGIIGRFLIAMVLLLVLKNLNKHDPYIDKGIKWLIILGVIAISLGLLLMIFSVTIFNLVWLLY